MTVERADRDRGAALAVVLVALVLSGTISVALVERAHVIAVDLAARRQRERTDAALDDALRAAVTAGTCTSTRWWLDDQTVSVECSSDTGTGPPDTGTTGAAAAGSDTTEITEVYEATVATSLHRARVVVRRRIETDSTGTAASSVVSMVWEAPGRPTD